MIEKSSSETRQLLAGETIEAVIGIFPKSNQDGPITPAKNQFASNTKSSSDATTTEKKTSKPRNKPGQ